MSPSKSVVQYFNDKFLRKRHSVSAGLKFSSQHQHPTTLTTCQPANSTNLLAVASINNNNNNTSNVNHKLEKSVSNQSLLFNAPSSPPPPPQIRLDDSKVEAEAAITTRLKVPPKPALPSKSNAVSRSGSFKSKKKTKRSKSAPINQRKILVNSTFYTVLSTNYGDSQLSPLNRVCVLCEKKQHSQTQCHNFK